MRRAAAESFGAREGAAGSAETLANEPFPDELDAAGSGVTAASEAMDREGTENPSLGGDRLPEETETPSTTFDRRLVGKLVADRTMLQGCREQYRRLAATLHHAQAATDMKVVMVASALAGEGKTLTAANLALTFSESYKRSVLLIDADLRRPSQHTVFGVPGLPGLSEGLMTPGDRPLAVHEVSDHLTILSAGRPTSDPMAGLTSMRMAQLVEEARRSFDWVILDTPPIGLMSDANLLASMADGAILVVRAGSTPYYLVQRAVEALGQQRLLGTVLNRATSDAQAGNRYYDYYRYYQTSPGKPAAET
jgi:capsular exopolysaccharide synthesis family protein